MEISREKQIDLQDYLQVLLKRRWIVIAFFAIVVLIIAIHTFTATPIYKATARIVIEKENPNLISIQEVISMDATGTDYYQTQYKIIESRTVARGVIKRLNLENSIEFFPEPKDDIISSVRTWIHDTVGFLKEWIKSLLRTGAKNSALTQKIDELSPDSGLVSAFIGRIQVGPIRNSRLVDVSVEAKSPVMAARMANELVRTYINQNLEIKLAAAKDAVQWLGDRIDDERKKVEDAENALLRYKEQHGIITDFSSEIEKITAQKLATLNSQVIGAESRRVEAETRYRQARALENSPEMLDSIPEVLSNELIREIKTMEVHLYNRMSELSKKYGRKHPQMVAIDSELADLKKRKAIEVKRVVNSLRNGYKLAVAMEESLKKALEKQKNESLALNKKAVQYGVLRRQVESSRSMYELLIKRFKETNLTEEMKTGNIRIIDKAEVPRFPVKPKKKLNLLLAIVIGLTVGVGLAFFLEYLDNTIKLPDEIKEHFDIPCLGIIPVFPKNESKDGVHADLVSVHSSKSVASESFRGVRTSILFSSIEARPRVILVASAGPREGKTVCTSNLAITMAQTGSRVVILDSDMRRPEIHKLFNTRRNKGMSSVLAGSSALRDVIVPTDIENLDLIPCGPIPPNPSEMLGSQNMLHLIEALKKKYARIVIDSAPITAVTDAVVLSHAADSVLMVIRAADTPRQMVQNCIAKLKAVNANILGAVLNCVDMSRNNYYYYYQYYYYYYGEDGRNKKKFDRRKRRKNSYG